ncbi:MAG: Mrp/NBP35 family ATP-binding protein [Thermoplasmatota archaeon]
MSAAAEPTKSAPSGGLGGTRSEVREGAAEAAPQPGRSGLGGMPIMNPAQANAQMARMQEQLKQRMAIADNLRRFKRTLIVMSGKGGVGKSTVAVNLAAELAREGATVGLLDLDLTNPNVPAMLGLEDAKPGGSAEGIEPVVLASPIGSGTLRVMSTEFFIGEREQAIIWRGPIKMKMIQDLLGMVRWGDLDYLIIDLPPGTSDEPLSIAQHLKDADGVVLVTTPQAVSVLDVTKSIKFVRTLGLNLLGVVENMSAFVCPHCGESTPIFGSGGGAALARTYDTPLLGQIPIEPAVAMAGTEGVPFVWREGDSATKKAFAEVIANVKRALPKK